MWFFPRISPSFPHTYGNFSVIFRGSVAVRKSPAYIVPLESPPGLMNALGVVLVKKSVAKSGWVEGCLLVEAVRLAQAYM